MQRDRSRVVGTPFGHDQNVGTERSEFVLDGGSVTALQCEQAEQQTEGQSDACCRQDGTKRTTPPFLEDKPGPRHVSIP
jgi:hypothetical protein